MLPDTSEQLLLLFLPSRLFFALKHSYDFAESPLKKSKARVGFCNCLTLRCTCGVFATIIEKR